MTYLTYLRIINNKKYDYGYLYHIKDKEVNLLGFLKSKKNSGLKEGKYDITLSNTPKDFNNLLHQLSSKFSKGIPCIKVEGNNQKTESIPIMYANKELLVSRNTILYSSRASVQKDIFNVESKETYKTFYDIIKGNDKTILTIQDVDLVLTIIEETNSTEKETNEIKSLLNEEIQPPTYNILEDDDTEQSTKKTKKSRKKYKKENVKDD